jgi:hypothetical protein
MPFHVPARVKAERFIDVRVLVRVTYFVLPCLKRMLIKIKYNGTECFLKYLLCWSRQVARLSQILIIDGYAHLIDLTPVSASINTKSAYTSVASLAHTHF